MRNKQIEKSYLKYKNHIYNFIFRLANDHELAMDVTQQTFLNALSQSNNIIFTKLGYIALARDIYYVEANRKKNISFDRIDQSTELHYINEQRNQPPLSNALKELQMNIEKIITLMPIAIREIMILYFIENLSIIEITEITKRSIVDIKINLHHARFLFEKTLVNNMKTKIPTSNDLCNTYLKLTENINQFIITKAEQFRINKHISNCKFCINSNEQLKRTGILLNLTPLFKAPDVLDNMIYNDSPMILNTARILPFINPVIIGFIMLISFGRIDYLNTFL